MIVWDDAAQARLRQLRATEGPNGRPLSYRAIAKLMGHSRNAICQAVHRYVLGKPVRGGKSYKRDTTRALGHPKFWTEDYLTERWADRKKRLGRPLPAESASDTRPGA